MNIEYFKCFPFNDENLLDGTKIDTVNTYYKVYDMLINGNLIQINEYIVQKKLKKVIYKDSFYKDIISQYHYLNFSHVSYEVEKKIDDNFTLIFGETGNKEKYLLVRGYNQANKFSSETIFEQGYLNQYDEWEYNEAGELKESRTFIGKAGWAIEKNKYD